MFEEQDEYLDQRFYFTIDALKVLHYPDIPGKLSLERKDEVIEYARFLSKTLSSVFLKALDKETDHDVKVFYAQHIKFNQENLRSVLEENVNIDMFKNQSVVGIDVINSLVQIKVIANFLSAFLNDEEMMRDYNYAIKELFRPIKTLKDLVDLNISVNQNMN